MYFPVYGNQTLTATYIFHRHFYCASTHIIRLLWSQLNRGHLQLPLLCGSACGPGTKAFFSSVTEAYITSCIGSGEATTVCSQNICSMQKSSVQFSFLADQQNDQLNFGMWHWLYQTSEDWHLNHKVCQLQIFVLVLICKMQFNHMHSQRLSSKMPYHIPYLSIFSHYHTEGRPTSLVHESSDLLFSHFHMNHFLHMGDALWAHYPQHSQNSNTLRRNFMFVAW